MFLVVRELVDKGRLQQELHTRDLRLDSDVQVAYGQATTSLTFADCHEPPVSEALAALGVRTGSIDVSQ